MSDIIKDGGGTATVESHVTFNADDLAFELVAAFTPTEVRGTGRFIYDDKAVYTDTANWASATSRRKVCKAVAQKLNDATDNAIQQIEDKVLAKVESLRAQHEQETDEVGEDGQPQKPQPTYAESPSGILRRNATPQGAETWVPLTNFTARIVADVQRDDGVERAHTFDIEATLHGRTRKFTVPANRFEVMDWPIEQMGAKAIIYPGYSATSHARTAIQILSNDVEEREVFAHLGWRKIGDEWLYLHAGGAIGRNGHVDGVAIQVHQNLNRFRLPDPPTGQKLREAVRATLGMWKVGPDQLVIPVWCSIWRAILGDADYGVYVAGGTGRFKTELAALAQQHFGADMDSRHLPGSWSSTDNAMEEMLFAAKDALVVVDDFAPSGSTHDIARLHQKADRLVRAIGNHSGRQRMRSDGTMRDVRPPRGFMLSTGEDIPNGQSIRARLHIVEVGEGDIMSENLTVCQRDAKTCQYVSACSAYIKWLACQKCQECQRQQQDRWRVAATTPHQHRRTPAIVASLAEGLDSFLAFAMESRCINEQQKREYWRRGWKALVDSASKQEAEHQAVNPAERFVELLQSAISSGEAHLIHDDGSCPDDPERHGWRRRISTLTESGFEPVGRKIGWIKKDTPETIYLDPDAAMAAVRKMQTGSASTISLSETTMWKRLGEAGKLVREEKRQTWKVRRMVQTAQRSVLELQTGTLIFSTDKPDIPDNRPNPDAETEDFGDFSALSET